MRGDTGLTGMRRHKQSSRKAESGKPRTHQQRVNETMFNAIELLGRRLEKTESERDRLASRLAEIEAAARVDDETGQMYLPVVIERPEDRAGASGMMFPKWAVMSSMMSSALAILAIVLVMTRPSPQLSKEELRAQLAELGLPQFAQLSPESSAWRVVGDDKTDIKPRVTYTEPVDKAPVTTETWDRAGAEPSFDDAPEIADFSADEVAPDKPFEETFDKMMTEMGEIQPAAGETETPVKAKPVETAKVEPKTAPKPAPEAEPKAQPKPKPQAKATPKPAPAPKVAQPKPAPQKAIEKQPAQTASATPRGIGNAGAPGVSAAIQYDENLPEKIQFLQKRAYDGLAEAQHDLATLYASGTAVDQDFDRASYWFYKAAENGVPNAHYNLGVMYHQGLGVAKDLSQAVAWYENAAELGHPEAMYNLGIAYLEGVGTKADTMRGVSFFRRAARAGVSQAAYNLGILYESNYAQDAGSDGMAEATEWYRQAAELGHMEAAKSLARLGREDILENMDIAYDLTDIQPAAGDTGDRVTGVAAGAARAVTADRGVVSRIQQLLVDYSLLPPGQTDGVMNPQTEDAIRAFQGERGLAVDGVASRELLDYMLYGGSAE